MITTPISARVRTELILMFMQDYGLAPPDARVVARTLLDRMRARDLDVVHGDWMAGEASPGGTGWDDLAALAEGLVVERNGIKPWNPPELQ